MAVPHFRVVRPAGTEHARLTAKNTRIFVTFPDMPEIELTSMRGLEFRIHIDSADIVILEMMGSVDVEIAHGN